ncbi:MAG: universal stress protein [Gammaproteobacteria bacterium]|nr:universal stress protein [Gammaproteobacteria bacterium]
MHKTVLVPIDIAHLREGKATIDIALANAGEDSSIILLNVIEDIPKWAAAQLPRGTLDKSKQAAYQELNAIAQSFSVPIEVDIRMGHTYKVILDVAEEKKADLIVIASHRPGFQDYYLGSTAAKVVRHANCSVHVVR